MYAPGALVIKVAAANGQTSSFPAWLQSGNHTLTAPSSRASDGFRSRAEGGYERHRHEAQTTRAQRAVALAMFEYGDLPAALDADTR